MRALILAGLFLANAGPALAQSMTLEVDQTRPLRLSTPVTGVVIGNAGVADVIVHDPRTLFIMGKSVGSTQVLAVDGNGRTVFSGRVEVRVGAEDGLLTVQRGRESTTAICKERCIEVPHPEATREGMASSVARISARNAYAKGDR
jgi:Pilus formation protein N terminal region